MIGKLVAMIFARLLSPVGSFLIIVLVARKWGGESLGQFSVISAWLVIFQYCSMLGITEYISREIGYDRRKTPQYLTNGLVLVTLSSAVGALAMMGCSLISNAPADVKQSIAAASLALPFTASALLCHAVFTAFQKIRYVAAASAAENLIFLALGVTVIFKSYGLSRLVWSLVLARAFGCGVAIAIMLKYIGRPNLTIDWRLFRRMLPTVTVFGLTGLAFHVFMRTDILVLSHLRGMLDAGMYSSCSKLFELYTMLPLTFYLLNLPVAANAYREFKESAMHKMEHVAGQFFAVVFLAFGIGVLFAEPLLKTIFGGQFVSNALILRVLLVVFVAHSLQITFEMCCQAAGYQKAAMFIAIFRTAANIILNVALISWLSLLGAAFAVLISMLLSLGGFWYVVKRELGGMNLGAMLTAPVAACLSAMVLLYPLSQLLDYRALLPLFVAAYATFVIAFHGFSLRWLKAA